MPDHMRWRVAAFAVHHPPNMNVLHSRQHGYVQYVGGNVPADPAPPVPDSIVSFVNTTIPNLQKLRVNEGPPAQLCAMKVTDT